MKKGELQDDIGGLRGFPLTPIMWVAFGGAVFAIIVAGFYQQNLLFSVLSNIIVLIASSLFSYKLTHDSERRKFIGEKNRLANSSRRRVNILSDELLSLSQEIQNVDDNEELRRIVTFTLRNLEQNARLSVRDIEDIAEIEPQGEVVSEAESVSASEVATASGFLDDVQFACSSCGYLNSTKLEQFIGATRTVSCVNCQTRLNVHRLAEGAVKVVDPLRKRLSNQAIRETSEQVTSGKFECPRCGNEISFASAAENGTVVRACYECKANIIYDVKRSKAILDVSRRPIYTTLAEVNECANCKNALDDRAKVDSEGREFKVCRNCQTVYVDERFEKVLVSVKCPGNCEKNLDFKVSKDGGEARKFCMDCLIRVGLDPKDGVPRVIEELSAPVVSYHDFEAGGKLCPHCGQTASGRTTQNKDGRRLSICWKCKNVFQLV